MNHYPLARLRDKGTLEAKQRVGERAVSDTVLVTSTSSSRLSARQLNKSSSDRATTLVALRRSSSTRCSSARLALLSSTVRGPAP